MNTIASTLEIIESPDFLDVISMECRKHITIFVNKIQGHNSISMLCFKPLRLKKIIGKEILNIDLFCEYKVWKQFC